MIGTIAGAVAGGVQPARSSGTVGAVWQAAVPEEAGPDGPAMEGPGCGPHPTSVSVTTRPTAASATARGWRCRGMPTAYPRTLMGDVRGRARIRGRHPEDV